MQNKKEIYIIGGINNNYWYEDSIEKFDITTETWEIFEIKNQSPFNSISSFGY